MIERARHRVYEILWGVRDHDPVSKTVNWFIVTLIVLNVGAAWWRRSATWGTATCGSSTCSS